MQEPICYRGKLITEADIEFINQLVAQNPSLSRRALSAKLCEAWNWVQPNGVLRDMVCRGLMLQLHRAGRIQLPPKRFSAHNPLAHRRKPPTCPLLTWTSIESNLAQIAPLQIRQVRRRPGEALFASLMETYHYLGYSQPVGEHLKHLIYAGGTPIGCLAWSSAPRHLRPRDQFIGWSQQLRRQNIHLLAYNSRFLILPWVKVPHLASHLLGQVAQVISADWQRLYHHPVHWLETFIDPDHFKGTCYRAANWIYLGRSTGRGKDGQSSRPNRSLKELWAYPLSRDFRTHLCRTDA